MSLLPGELEVLPLFPLPNVVFFPGTQLPLHVFEPRYRALVADCLERGPLAMAIPLLVAGNESLYAGSPPIHLIAGAGRIVAHEKLPDGRYNLLLDGVERVSLEELPGDGLLYRRARAKSLADDETRLTASERTALLSAAAALAAEVRKARPEFELGLASGDTLGRNADRLADKIVGQLEARQALLETTDVSARARLVTQLVYELLARLSASAAPGGAVPH